MTIPLGLAIFVTGHAPQKAKPAAPKGLNSVICPHGRLSLGDGFATAKSAMADGRTIWKAGSPQLSPLGAQFETWTWERDEVTLEIALKGGRIVAICYSNAAITSGTDPNLVEKSFGKPTVSKQDASHETKMWVRTDYGRGSMRVKRAGASPIVGVVIATKNEFKRFMGER